MSVEVKFTGEVAEVVIDMKRFVGPFMQAEALAKAFANRGAGAGVEAGPTPPAPAEVPVDQGQLQGELAKIRGPEGGTVVAEKGAAPTPSEAILPKYKVIFDEPPQAIRRTRPGRRRCDTLHGRRSRRSGDRPWADRRGELAKIRGPEGGTVVVGDDGVAEAHVGKTPAEVKRRAGRPPKGATVAEKGAAPTPSEAILPKYKVIFDDHEEHFDALPEAFERMADVIEAASDVATIDALVKHNEQWLVVLSVEQPKHLPLVKTLQEVITRKKADLAKPADPLAGMDDAPAAANDTKPFPTCAAYTADHARQALRAMATDTANELFPSDKLRSEFLQLQMKNTGGTKISEVAADKLPGFCEAISQALSAPAQKGLAEKWAEIKS